MADLVSVGRLQQVGFAKRGVVPTVPIVAGTLTPPTVFPRYIPPFDWNPEAPPLESEAHDGTAELPAQVAPGPRSLNGKKANVYWQPGDVFGNFAMAALGKETVTGDGISDPRAHNFERDQVAQLPTYDWWANGGAAPKGKQEGFAGMMMNALDMFITKAELNRLESEWNGMYYVGTGLSLTPVVAYQGARPQSFARVEALIDDVSQVDPQVVHTKIDNKVIADHTIRPDTTDASQIWTEGCAVNLDFEEIMTNVDEYDRFTSQSVTPGKLLIKVTSVETFTDGVLVEPYKWYILLPQFFYRTAVKTFPTGVVRVVFAGGALKGDGTLGEGGNTHAIVNKSIGIQYENGSVTPY